MQTTEVPPRKFQSKGSWYWAPQGAGKAREGVQLGLVGPPSAPGPLNLQPQAPPLCPTPILCSRRGGGACFLVSGPCLHVTLLCVHVALQLQHPRSSGLSVQDDRWAPDWGPCLPRTLGSTHFLWDPACLAENLESMHVTCSPARKGMSMPTSIGKVLRAKVLCLVRVWCLRPGLESLPQQTHSSPPT